MNGPLLKTESPTTAATPLAVLGPLSPFAAAAKTKLADYAELSKLRLSLLVLIVTGAGFCLGGGENIDVLRMTFCLVGTALVAFGASAWNQLLERRQDALMSRTADRPIPAGRIGEAEAATFGALSAIAGLVCLWLLTTGAAALIAAATLFLYVGVYTPLKRRTALNTLVGAIPGALPPLIGYASAAGYIDVAAATLFVILFAWQIPHFYAIAWLYRDDYARGGFRMLSVTDPTGVTMTRQTILFSCLLFGLSLTPSLLGVSGQSYLMCALLLGAAFVYIAFRFAEDRSRQTARLLLWGSILYLPLLMLALLIDRLG